MNEFLHIVTDSKRFTPPLSMPEAVGWIEALLTNRTVKLQEAEETATTQALRWMREHNLGRKRILDTHLASTFHTAGVRRNLTSNPADFVVFGVFELISP